MARGVSLASCCCYIVVMAVSMVLQASLGSCARGVVELDTLTFDKELSAHNHLIVKFDTSMASGAAVDAYNSFARLAAKQPEILVASVGVSPHGEKENEELANRFSITANDFPRILLFGHGQSSTAHSLSGNVTVESLVAFAKRYSDLYIALPGCLQEFDQLAAKTLYFASSNAGTFERDARKLASKLTDEDEIASANAYIKIFGLIVSRGPRFPSNEVNRVKKSLATELSEEKRKELQHKLNILQSFLPPPVDQNPNGKDEL